MQQETKKAMRGPSGANAQGMSRTHMHAAGGAACSPAAAAAEGWSAVASYRLPAAP